LTPGLARVPNVVDVTLRMVKEYASTHVLDTVTGKLTACRNREETTSCVGRVAFFVKATVRNPLCRDALAALGLPTDTQRFAIVDAFTAMDVQRGTKGVTMKQPWVTAVGGALVSAKLVAEANEFPRLLARVQDGATVLACPYKSKVTLRRPSPSAGSLTRLAIPLSSNYEQLYHRGETDNYAVHPVCRIDPRRCTTIYGKVEGPARAAVTAIRGTMLYFVHTYSNSNCRPTRGTQH
jgi:hypothetical protein